MGDGLSTPTLISQPLEGHMTLGKVLCLSRGIPKQGSQLEAVFQLHFQQGEVGGGRASLSFREVVWVVNITAPTTKEMVAMGNMMKLQSLIDNNICWLFVRKEVLK